MNNLVVAMGLATVLLVTSVSAGTLQTQRKAVEAKIAARGDATPTGFEVAGPAHFVVVNGVTKTIKCDDPKNFFNENAADVCGRPLGGSSE